MPDEPATPEPQFLPAHFEVRGTVGGLPVHLTLTAVIPPGQEIPMPISPALGFILAGRALEITSSPVPVPSPTPTPNPTPTPAPTAWSVTGGAGSLTITAAPTVAAPVVSGGVGTITITG